MCPSRRVRPPVRWLWHLQQLASFHRHNRCWCQCPSHCCPGHLTNIRITEVCHWDCQELCMGLVIMGRVSRIIPWVFVLNMVAMWLMLLSPQQAWHVSWCVFNDPTHASDGVLQLRELLFISREGTTEWLQKLDPYSTDQRPRESTIAAKPPVSAARIRMLSNLVSNVSIRSLEPRPSDNRSPTAPNWTSSPSLAQRVLSWNVKNVNASAGVPFMVPPVRMVWGGRNLENSCALACNWEITAAVFLAVSPSVMMDHMSTSLNQFAKLYWDSCSGDHLGGSLGWLPLPGTMQPSIAQGMVAPPKAAKIHAVSDVRTGASAPESDLPNWWAAIIGDGATEVPPCCPLWIWACIQESWPWIGCRKHVSHR